MGWLLRKQRGGKLWLTAAVQRICGFDTNFIKGQRRARKGDGLSAAHEDQQMGCYTELTGALPASARAFLAINTFHSPRL